MKSFNQSAIFCGWGNLVWLVVPVTILNWSSGAKERLKKCSFCWQLLWRMLTATQNTSLNMFLAGWCVFCCRQQEFANKPWDSPDITIMLAPLFSEGHATDLFVQSLGLNQALKAVCSDWLCENLYWNPGTLANMSQDTMGRFEFCLGSRVKCIHHLYRVSVSVDKVG